MADVFKQFSVLRYTFVRPRGKRYSQIKVKSKIKITGKRHNDGRAIRSSFENCGLGKTITDCLHSAAPPLLGFRGKKIKFYH